MAPKRDEDSGLKSKDLFFFPSFLEHVNARSREIAQKLDKDRYIYHAYAVLDSLSSTYSMFKYFFEVSNGVSNGDLIHDFVTSPSGIAVVTGEAIFLISFSLTASIYNAEKTESIKKKLEASWPYFRDVMKGLKNAYKGCRSSIQILGIINGMNLKYLVLPAGFALSIISAVNRYWLRDMVERRKQDMSTNKELLLTIQELSSLTSKDRKYYLKKIKVQDEEERIRAYLSVALDGFINGLYLYMGVVMLASLSPPLFIAMSVVSLIYTISCVVSRLYEEYNYQLQLIITKSCCQFALITKEMELIYSKILCLQEKVDKNEHDLVELKRLKKDLSRLIARFDETRLLLKEQTTHSYLTAGLLGIKYGLFAYGVVTSILFSVVNIFLVSATFFPPVLLVACIVSGLMSMIGFTAYMVWANKQHLQKQMENEGKDEHYAQLMEMKKNLETQDNAKVVTAELFEKALEEGVAPAPTQRFFFQEWFEVFRSIASGSGAGNNVGHFAMSPLQELDSHGHYQDTRLMHVVGAAQALLFAIVLGLRALARELGRPPLGQINPIKIKVTANVEASKEKKKTETPREPSKKKAPDSPPRTLLSLLGFFPTPKSSPSKKRKFSSDITRGLE